MQIDTSQHYRVALKPVQHTIIMLVGAGGTGSALAIDLARLLYHIREQGQSIHMQIIDPDVVEPKNVGRQQFSPFDVGQKKAVSMAERLNLWLGLDVMAVPEPFDANTPVMMPEYRNRSVRYILVGAVDNHQARTAMRDYIKSRQNSGDWWWVDAGNGEYTGQVLVGNITAGKVSLNSAFGLINGLPAPSVQMPELLQEEETAVAEPQLDCALAAIRDEQSLNVNRLMAVYAAQYVYDIVVRHELTTMGAFVSLSPPSANSRSITKQSLERFSSTDFSVEVLKGGIYK